MEISREEQLKKETEEELSKSMIAFQEMLRLLSVHPFGNKEEILTKSNEFLSKLEVAEKKFVELQKVIYEDIDDDENQLPITQQQLQSKMTEIYYFLDELKKVQKELKELNVIKAK
ncbi:hypothetical protein CL6EHI_159530 [Entamoeba histolytica]|nr:hypothetical protein CL6EHI_159530 [Entamoeba histolytica]